MALNKLALIRYKTIDECLRNKFRKWSLEDLIEKVGEVLYDYEGIHTGVSKRTIQLDIQNMRSDKLGYNAPIIIVDRKFYKYEDPEFSITKAPINDTDVEKLNEIIGVLKQFDGFNYFDEMSDIITKLENKLLKSTTNKSGYVQFESNKLLRGLEYLNPLYQAIIAQKPVLIEYQSFKARQSAKNIYYPYLLKEFKNRWFLIVKPKKGKFTLNLALDRIKGMNVLSDEKWVEYDGVDFDIYYSDLIGVTKNEQDRPTKVILELNKDVAPYVITKPLHPSQVIKKEDENSVIIQINVILNFELERELLGYGDMLKVLAPRILVQKIKRNLKRASEMYE
jgi:predicted DNA-binding transcriptional regulator YafY